MTILVFTFVSFLSFGSFLRILINNIYEAYAQEEGYCIDINIPDNQCYMDWNEVIAFLCTVKNIVGYNNTKEIGIECETGNPESSVDVYLFGNINTNFSEFFRSDNFEMLSGEMPVCGKKQIIIDYEYSLANQKNIGDIVVIKKEDRKLELSVVGIYKINKIPKVDIDNDGFYMECERPILLCDYLSFEEISGDMDFTLMSVYVNELSNMDNVYTNIKEKMNGNVLVIDTIKNHSNSTGTTINVISIMSNGVLFLSAVFFLVCVYIISIIWVNDHSSMIIIYKTLGDKNSNILKRLTCEIGIVCMPMCLASGEICRLFLQRFGKEILEFILNISRNSIDNWDSMNVERLYYVGFKEYIIISFVVGIVIIIWTFICSCFTVNKRCIGLNE